MQINFRLKYTVITFLFSFIPRNLVVSNFVQTNEDDAFARKTSLYLTRSM